MGINRYVRGGGWLGAASADLVAEQVEDHDELPEAVGGGQVGRPLAVLVAHVHVGAGPDQDLGDGHVPIAAGDVQRCAQVVRVLAVDDGALLDQVAPRFHVVARRRLPGARHHHQHRWRPRRNGHALVPGTGRPPVPPPGPGCCPWGRGPSRHRRGFRPSPRLTVHVSNRLVVQVGGRQHLAEEPDHGERAPSNDDNDR
ncbi:hypothetical protein PBRA_009293 [Plasmodiophora brassicae]|uniref:Uncharacterized protein n=1 Tax=Plasmodiophora brassicae TaxID=37360 RepID=A0A0G4J671_PLABS|nr:hypothetical protein PBRA_009293 [Plasmodiophora brassicae]